MKELFATALVITSAITGLVTEALKKILDESEKKYKPNILAMIVSIVVSVCVIVGYVLYTDTAFTVQTAVVGVALIVLSWLCAMLGYDKVIQTISQG